MLSPICTALDGRAVPQVAHFLFVCFNHNLLTVVNVGNEQSRYHVQL